MHFRSMILGSALVCGAIALTGCNFNSYAYRPDVHQGNLVTKEMIGQLEVGMARQQVMFVMGEPLIQSALHRQRWDYVYYVNPRYGNEEMRKVTLYFDDEDRLTKIESTPLPSEQQADEMILGHDTDFVPERMPERNRD